MTRAKKRVTAVGCPCLTGLGLGQFMLQDDSSDNYVPFWITFFNIFFSYQNFMILFLFNKINYEKIHFQPKSQRSTLQF